MDLFMPVVNGFEALDLLHFSDDTKHIPVIMLTNIADSEKEKEAYRRGASMFVTKSNIENAELIRQVHHVITSFDASIH
jgi:CheY-like chemotaxis protein